MSTKDPARPRPLRIHRQMLGNRARSARFAQRRRARVGMPDPARRRTGDPGLGTATPGDAAGRDERRCGRRPRDDLEQRRSSGADDRRMVGQSCLQERPSRVGAARRPGQWLDRQARSGGTAHGSSNSIAWRSMIPMTLGGSATGSRSSIQLRHLGYGQIKVCRSRPVNLLPGSDFYEPARTHPDADPLNLQVLASSPSTSAIFLIFQSFGERPRFRWLAFRAVFDRFESREDSRRA